MSFEQRAWGYVREVLCGCVVTYGDVAEAAGDRNAAQSAGNAMAKAYAENMDVPWWRVVKKDGSISPGPPGDQRPAEQRKRLEAEGVTFMTNGRVDPEHLGTSP